MANQQSSSSGSWDEKKHPRSPIGEFATNAGQRQEAERKNLSRRADQIRAEQAAKAAKKKKGGGGGKSAAKPKAPKATVESRQLAAFVKSVTGKYGTSPEERKKKLQDHANLDLDLTDEEYKALETEVMQQNNVTQDKLYSDLGMFVKLAQAIDDKVRRRRAAKRQQSAADAAARTAQQERARQYADAEAKRHLDYLKSQQVRASGGATARTFPVPRAVQSAWLGASATLDELDLVSRHTGMAGEWATRISRQESARLLDAQLRSSELPRGVVVPFDSVDADVVIALVDRRGVVAGALLPGDGPVETIALDVDEVAFALRTLTVDGQWGVILAASTPIAFLDKLGPITAAAGDVPTGGQLIAIVDPLDKTAVLDLITVLPGPRVMRRFDGQWHDDPTWVNILRGVKPPPVVEVTASLAPSVIAQVDESTKGQPFEETVTASAEPSVTSYLEDAANDAALEMLPLLAAQGRISSRVYDVAGVMPAHLQRYWIAGPGAAKIRWGTPGAWRRCHRQLSRYMGPFKAKGACTNLGQKLGGKGVAWDVGSGAKRAIKRALKEAARG